MILRPPSVASQQPGLQALTQVINQYPVCESWIFLLNDIQNYWSQLTPKGLQAIFQIATQTGKVLSYIESVAPASVPVYQYIGKLALGSADIAVSANLASINAAGSLNVVLSAAATGALTTLQSWDDVLGTNQPVNIGPLGYMLVTGVTVGVASS